MPFFWGFGSVNFKTENIYFYVQKSFVTPKNENLYVDKHFGIYTYMIYSFFSKDKIERFKRK